MLQYNKEYDEYGKDKNTTYKLIIISGLLSTLILFSVAWSAIDSTSEKWYICVKIFEMIYIGSYNGILVSLIIAHDLSNRFYFKPGKKQQSLVTKIFEVLYIQIFNFIFGIFAAGALGLLIDLVYLCILVPLTLVSCNVDINGFCQKGEISINRYWITILLQSLIAILIFISLIFWKTLYFIYKPIRSGIGK